jgi:gamma-tubulin complex component 5
MSSLRINDDRPRNKDALEVSTSQFGNDSREMGLLTLSEIFLICLSGLLENGGHVYEYLRTLHADSVPNSNAFIENGSKSNLKETEEDTCSGNITEKTWVKLLKDATSGRKCDGMEKTINAVMEKPVFAPGCPKDASSNAVEGFFTLSCYENPAVTACREVLLRNPTSWSELNISESFHLPPLNDGNMRRAIFADGHSAGTSTDYKFGFQFDDLEYVRQEDDRRTLEDLYAFPTLLPCAKVRLASEV